MLSPESPDFASAVSALQALQQQVEQLKQDLSELTLQKEDDLLGFQEHLTHLEQQIEALVQQSQQREHEI